MGEPDDSAEIEEIGERQGGHADLGRPVYEGFWGGSSGQKRERGAHRQLDEQRLAEWTA